MAIRPVKKDTVSRPSKPASTRRRDPVDPYLPDAGNHGYSVSRYDLDLGYRVAPNRLTGVATISLFTTEPLRDFSLDLSRHLSVSKVSWVGAKLARFRHSGGKPSVAAPPVEKRVVGMMKQTVFLLQFCQVSCRR